MLSRQLKDSALVHSFQVEAMFRIVISDERQLCSTRRMLVDSCTFQLVAYRPELSYGRGVSRD